MSSRAVILLSGGLDSATAFAIAKSAGHECYALSFNYGQRSVAELKSAAALSVTLGAKEHKIVSLDMQSFGGSALTDSAIAVPDATPLSDEIPITYVPARNTVFLSLAVAWAEVLEAGHIYIGVNAVDYSGYPDCRPEFIKAFQTVANLGTKLGVEGHPLQIHTPLSAMTKADIIKCGTERGLDYGLTVSCYQADEDGKACGTCDSCYLRREGFASAGIEDPTRYQ